MHEFVSSPRKFLRCKTRKAHKNRVFIINPLSARLIFQGQVQGLFQGQGRSLGQGNLQGQGQSEGHVQGHGRGQGLCVWLYAPQARGLSADSAAGAIYRINSLIYTGP